MSVLRSVLALLWLMPIGELKGKDDLTIQALHKLLDLQMTLYFCLIVPTWVVIDYDHKYRINRSDFDLVSVKCAVYSVQFLVYSLQCRV